MVALDTVSRPTYLLVGETNPSGLVFFMDNNVVCLLGLVYNLMTNYSLTWLLVSVAGCLGYDVIVFILFNLYNVSSFQLLVV